MCNNCIKQCTHVKYKLTTIVSVTYYRIQQFPVKYIYNKMTVTFVNLAFREIAGGIDDYLIWNVVQHESSIIATQIWPISLFFRRTVTFSPGANPINFFTP